MLKLEDSQGVCSTGDKLLVLLEHFEGKNIIVDQIGSNGTLKFLNNFWVDLTVGGNDNRILWLNGENEDNYSIDVDEIEYFGKDKIMDEVEIIMDNGIEVIIGEM
jgi:hypothetical protein